MHRDVKPANIRVTPEGEVKIMDFGIAHLQSSTMTKSGLVLGTVHYMAPEQIEGQKVDHRADIFSVGAIAYELIAYKRPFDGETITAVMYKIMHDRPDPKALPETGYSPVLQEIIMRALARDGRERYQSLDEMQRDIVAIVRKMPTSVGVGAAAAKPAPPAASSEQERGRQQEIARLRAAVERARAEGQLQRALLACRRLLEMAPQDKGAAEIARQIDATIQDRQVEQLCETALAYAKDGDTELAGKIMGKVEKLAPESPRLRQLRTVLSEESARHAAGALTATAQEHIALGNLEEARAAAEEALLAQPSNAVALEIRDRARPRWASAASRRACTSGRDASGRNTSGVTPAPRHLRPRPRAAPRCRPRVLRSFDPSEGGRPSRGLDQRRLDHSANNHQGRKAHRQGVAIDPGKRRPGDARILGALASGAAGARDDANGWGLWSSR